MATLTRYLALITGLLAPLLAPYLYAQVYTSLTESSTNRDQDWLPRLAISTFVMIVPFLATVILAWLNWRLQRQPEPATRSEKRRQRQSKSRSAAAPSRRVPVIVIIGLVVASSSLFFTEKPIRDGVSRWKQMRNLAKKDVPAPAFATVDLDGNPQRLSDHKGQVVVVNLWATWCGPCRAEMPQLDRLYQERKNSGLAVFGISTEDVDLQRRYRQFVPVTYPLLTVNGNVPDLYRDVARYPATFLIDRQGRLQPAPSPDQPFEDLQAAIERLLQATS